MKRLSCILFFACIASAASAQTPVTIDATISSDGIAALNAWVAGRSSLTSTSTTLAAAVASGDTIISVSNATSVAAVTPCAILIDQEAILIGSANGNTLNVTARGLFGTTPASHSNNAFVQLLQYPSIQAFLKATLAQVVGQIMGQVGSPNINTQNAAIATAQAAIAATKAAAVQ